MRIIGIRIYSLISILKKRVGRRGTKVENILIIQKSIKEKLVVLLEMYNSSIKLVSILLVNY
jgi:hypothetical protein